MARLQFRDAQTLARSHPESFEPPSPMQLQQIGPGSYVKVSVAFPENDDGMDGERFWVEVTERDGAALLGRVDNQLIASEDHGLQRDDLVEFSVNNVYQVHE